MSNLIRRLFDISFKTLPTKYKSQGTWIWQAEDPWNVGWVEQFNLVFPVLLNVILNKRLTDILQTIFGCPKRGLQSGSAQSIPGENHLRTSRSHK